MKKLFAFSLAIVAIAAVSCQKEQDFQKEEKALEAEGIEVNVLAEKFDTKTAIVDGATPSVKWLSTDAIKLFEVKDDGSSVVKAGTASSTTTLSDSDTRASFKVTLSGTPSSASYSYSAVYPASAVSLGGSNPQFVRLTLPATQHLNGNNMSDDSDILISDVFDNGASRVTADQSLSFSFRRIGTVVKLTLSGITADEKIKSITLTAPQIIAGRVKYEPSTSSIVPDSFNYDNTNYKTVTLQIDDVVATGTDVFWFRVLSETPWAEGEQISIVVETDKAYYKRDGSDGEHAKITLGSGQTIKFHDGGLTRFGIGLGSYRIAKSEPVEYTLVEDNAKLVDGAKFLIVYGTADGTVKAMGTFGSNLYNPTDVTVESKVIALSGGEDVQINTLEDAGDGKFYIKDGDGSYLYYNSGNNVHRSTFEDNDAHKWTVTKDGITNVGSSTRVLQYNTGSPRFACYTGSQQNVSLYVDLTSLLPLGISFATPSYDLVNGSAEFTSFAGQTVTKAGGVGDDREVTYAIDSDDDGVITSVNASTGAVVLSGNVGSATVKATVGSSASYRSGTVTYSITVSSAPKTYIRATSVESGNSYLIIAKYGDDYFMATPVTSGTYGYLQKTQVIPDGAGRFVLSDVEDNLFTLTATTGGFRIQQSNDKYLYQNSTYTSFNLSDAANGVYSFTLQGDDTFKIQMGSYWIQYSSSYNSFGQYNSAQANSSLPYLYMEDDGLPHLSGADVTFSDPTADIEFSTLHTLNLTSVTYSVTSKPDWIESVTFDSNTMNVESKDNKTLDARNGVITVKAIGAEGNVSANINVSQPASVFSASSTADMSFAWDASVAQTSTITSTYVLTEATNLEVTGTDSDKFVASLTRVGVTDTYTLEVIPLEDNESGADYTATATVSRDGLEISINLSQAYEGGGGTLSIDFEGASSSYSDWTFTNMTSQQTGSITAHGGTYYGTTGGKASASIQTKEKISSPGTLTFYVSKQSTNTTASTWKVQTSTNGSTWIDRKEQDATSMGKGSWTEVSIDLSSYSDVYVRVYYSGSTAVRNIDDLTLTYN